MLDEPENEDLHGQMYILETLPKAQRTQGFKYIYAFNTFSSKQKLQQTMKSWSNFSLVLFEQL